MVRGNETNRGFTITEVIVTVVALSLFLTAAFQWYQLVESQRISLLRQSVANEIAYINLRKFPVRPTSLTTCSNSPDGIDLTSYNNFTAETLSSYPAASALVTAATTTSSPTSPTVEYLVVGGGGGGAMGGGGGGGVLYATDYSVNYNQAYAVTVGAGGAIRTAGSDSKFHTIVAKGGGSGGRFFAYNNATAGGIGGSGGGAAGVYYNTLLAGGSGTAGQGNSGGNNGGGWLGTGQSYIAGGGGGAGQAGSNSTTASPGKGGDGVSYFGAFYGGGGGGGFIREYTGNLPGGPAGQGGGGIGGGSGNTTGYITPTAGSPNTGGGGGGGNDVDATSPAAAGGSGIVILKVPDTVTATFTSGVTQTSTTLAGFKTYRITAAGASDTVTFAGGSASSTPGIAATGGTIIDNGGFRYHVFTSSGTFIVTSAGQMTTTLVGGGGGGGGGHANSGAGAGAGAGGKLVTRSASINTGTYNIVVGDAGSGGANGVAGNSGQASTGLSYTAAGGQGGGSGWSGDARIGLGGTTGGSAGGGRGLAGSQGGANGGGWDDAASVLSTYIATGAGGADVGGDYSGGGGGGGVTVSVPGVAAINGTIGSNAVSYYTENAGPGGTGYGAGGGGASGPNAGGAGAKGIVIIRYALQSSSASGGISGVTQSVKGFPVDGCTGTNFASKTFKVESTVTYNGGKVTRVAFVSTAAPPKVDFLVVAGGGGGGSDMGGGGGGGGVISKTNTELDLYTPLTLTVGAGGAGAPAGVGQVRGTNGGNSVFGSNVAIGGGGGASNHDRSDNRAGNGGSGGGASGGAVAPNGGSGGGGGYGGGAAGTGTPGQGYNGSFGIYAWYPGGGGGAGGAGGTNPANGGPGIASTILGTTYYFAGGGGGSGYSGCGGNGGIGGGGGGAVCTTNGGGSALNSGSGGGGGGINSQTNTPGGNAGANTGGGGGGGAHYSANNKGGNGGSGVIIIKIPNKYKISFSSGVTFTLNTATTGFNIYTVTEASSSDTATLRVVSGTINAELLVVAGGGGGGMDMGGGGGGGGVIYQASTAVELNAPIPLTVGAGGAGAPAAGTNGQNSGHNFNIPPANGGNSRFDSFIAIGGGGGGSSYWWGSPAPMDGFGFAGGSGGGASGYANATGRAGAGTAGQGNSGGGAGGSYYSGGGGGAGGVGSSGPSQANGGPGVQYPSLSPYYFGGGGGGAAYSLASGGNGGIGGGGGGAVGTTTGGAGINNGSPGGGGCSGCWANTPGGNAGANTGGGGGGGSHYNANNKGGDGGSGVIIIKIPDSYSATFTSGVTQTVNTATAGFKIYTITATSANSTVSFSGTGTSSSSTTTPAVPTDPLYSSVVALLKFDGSNGSTTITDDSPLKKDWSSTAGATISTAQKKFGAGSLDLGASTGYAGPQAGQQTNFIFGSSQNFTIEAWIYPTSPMQGYVMDSRWSNYNYYSLYVSGTGQLGWATEAAGAGSFASAAGAVVANQWQHIAVSRASGTIRLFVNGTQVASRADTGNYDGVPSTRPLLGVDANSTTFAPGKFNGFIDSLRITREARYTSSFTAPTEDFPTTATSSTTTSPTVALLKGDGANNSTTITDSSSLASNWVAAGGAKISTTQSKFGGASIFFPNGPTDYVYPSAASSNFAFGTEDFTIEAFFWTSGNVGYPTYSLFDWMPASGTNYATLSYLGGGGPGFGYWVNGVIKIEVYPNIPYNTWHHVALSRSGTTTRLFWNGNQVATYTDTTNYPAVAGYPRIGGGGWTSSSSNVPINLYLDEIRITKGLARYTSNFTAPTAAF